MCMRVYSNEISGKKTHSHTAAFIACAIICGCQVEMCGNEFEPY